MLFNEGMICMDLNALTKEDAIRQLAMIAADAGKLVSIDEYIESVLAREKTYSTGVGNGIAIPHGRSKAVKETFIVFGKSGRGVEWDALDGKPVHLIFLLGVPEAAENEHLKILSQLSRRLMNENFVEHLKRSESKNEIIQAFKDFGEN
ncbi:PTS sugar transporter subunit IIA [Thermosediminibacter litoriperuensis]|uniref:PTS system IIA component (Fru family) n=1 Tax=Thermosediminibacter litoriperuensis TaxID=291989 RepID=A0A5S5ASJ2_9FIRM|nr:PTS sugar transporter subunit IIA [Thermosediminibacter litoriperuensis]TYP55407.1 PTS system IIA component (Fru family) [Thermosediminibacter litoriperuensis]